MTGRDSEGRQEIRGELAVRKSGQGASSGAGEAGAPWSNEPDPKDLAGHKHYKQGHTVIPRGLQTGQQTHTMTLCDTQKNSLKNLINTYLIILIFNLKKHVIGISNQRFHRYYLGQS